jgi:hypothetical protein
MIRNGTEVIGNEKGMKRNEKKTKKTKRNEKDSK